MNPIAHPESGLNGGLAALTVDRAIGELRRGRAICVETGAETGPRHALVFAAVEAASAALLARLGQHGEPHLWLTAERARALGVTGAEGTPVALAVPAAPTAETAETVRVLAGASPLPRSAEPVTPLGVDAVTTAFAAAGLMLAKAGRLLPAIIGVVQTESGDPAVPPDPTLLRLRREDVEHHVRFARRSVQRLSDARVPLADSLETTLVLFRDEHSLGEHVAVVIGTPEPASAVPVRLHSACLTGDLLGSLRCDCGEQLRDAVRQIEELGGGVLLYLDQEGRGIGLANKLRAYRLQDAGLDTVDADRHLGFLDDERSYDVAAEMLSELGIGRIRLLTNNPRKIEGLAAHGIEVVGRLPLVMRPNVHNERYLRTKRERAGHLD